MVIAAVSTEAAEVTPTNAPSVKLFVLPKASEVMAAAERRRTNRPSEALQFTNTVVDLTLSSSTEKADAEEVQRMRLEYINARSMVGPVRPVADQSRKRAIDKLPLLKGGGGLLSKNPNARRNPLEVDGW